MGGRKNCTRIMPPIPKATSVAVVAYATAGCTLYKNPDAAGPMIMAEVHTPDDMAIIGGSPPSGATIGYIDLVAGDKNARHVPNNPPITNIGHTASGSEMEYHTNPSAHSNSPQSESAAMCLRLYLSATLPLTNTKSAIGKNSASPSQPMSIALPVLSKTCLPNVAACNITPT